jgi:hypothetical protein
MISRPMAAKEDEKPLLLASEGFADDLGKLREAAWQEQQQYPNDKDPAKNVHRALYRETLRELQNLQNGSC